MNDLEFVRELLDKSMDGSLPYVILGVVAVMVFSEQLVGLSLLSPGSWAVIFVSFLAFAGAFPIPLMIVLMFFAALGGTQLQYYLGEHHGETLIRKLNRFPQVLDLSKARDIKVNSWAVIISYNLPQLRGIVPFMAGMTHMPKKRWLIASSIGIAVWLTTFMGMGLGSAFLFDGDFDKALDWVWAVNNGPLGWVFWIVSIGLVLYYFRKQIYRFFHKRRAKVNPEPLESPKLS